MTYYSRKGSNRYLAEKIAKNLACDGEEIKPRVNVMPLVLMKVTFGIRSLKHNIKDYDMVVMCGPIYIGSMAAPLRNFINKYSVDISNLAFATCCGSTDEKKDEKYGYNNVFKNLNEILGDKCAVCEAFPISLVISEEQKEDSNAIMNTRLNDDTFKGEIVERFNQFLDRIKERM